MVWGVGVVGTSLRCDLRGHTRGFSHIYYVRNVSANVSYYEQLAAPVLSPPLSLPRLSPLLLLLLPT